MLWRTNQFERYKSLNDIRRINLSFLYIFKKNSKFQSQNRKVKSYESDTG